MDSVQFWNAQPDELRKGAEKAREDIESGVPARILQAQADVEAIAAEAEEVQQQVRQAQDERYERIMEGKGIGGWFAEAGGFIVLIGGIAAFIATIAWRRDRGVYWVWSVVALVGIALGTWILVTVVFLKALSVSGSAALFALRQRPKALARARKRQAQRQKRAETIQKVRSFSLSKADLGRPIACGSGSSVVSCVG